MSSKGLFHLIISKLNYYLLRVRLRIEYVAALEVSIPDFSRVTAFAMKVEITPLSGMSAITVKVGIPNFSGMAAIAVKVSISDLLTRCSTISFFCEEG
jgi:hypothetical protein